MKEFRKKVEKLFQAVHEIESGKSDALPLPERTYFIDDDVVCFPRPYGESRFPYGVDGFYMWASSSGYISANESTFYVLLPSGEGKEPYLEYYAGIEQNDGSYFPIALLGVGKMSREKDVKRATVYSKAAVYYLTEYQNLKFCVRLYVNNQKEIVTSVLALNEGEKRKIYLSSFYNCLFKYESGESVETKWFKKCSYQEDRFLFESPEDVDRKTHIENFGLLQRKVSLNPIEIQNTTSRMDYVGGKSNSLHIASPLFNGNFEKKVSSTRFTDTAIAGDLIHFFMEPEQRADYVLSFSHQKAELLNKKMPSIANIDSYVKEKEQYYLKRKTQDNMFSIRFKDWMHRNIHDDTLNQFLDYVLYQVEYCALAKNSGTIFLGVRDVVQQLEALLMWRPAEAKQKLLEVLSVIDPSGNPPRQYSLPPVGCNEARMDLRPFIDQGVWIISTIYTYLCYTNDYDFLNDTCGYFKINGPSSALKVEQTDRVIDHMIKIMGYLESKIDEKTHCLRTIYGDWNDALDGLGASKDHEGYGSGVSVMATCQFVQNLREMIQILEEIHWDSVLIEHYKKLKADIENGLMQHAIVSKENERKIVHGWGDKKSYYVGSFDDVDHQSRDSLTSNAFWVLSSMIEKDPSLKTSVLNAYQRLDSQYGLKTFHPYFAENVRGVGRIVHLPKGTAENGATYVHATIFGIDSLYSLGESKLAVRQLEKILPITHQHISTSPFVMSNSYVYNEEEHMDGESMSDWYTGSSTVLLKSFVHGLFGVQPTLNGVIIHVSPIMPARVCDLHVCIKGLNVHIRYENKYRGKRKYFIDGKEIQTTDNVLRNTKEIYLSNEFFTSRKEYPYLEIIVED